MSLPLLVDVLTALAALVVVLTRVRLRGRGRGTHHIGTFTANTHLIAGLLALAIWVVFLVSSKETVAGGSLVGVIALFFWWVTAIVGLLILLRWLPTRGKHAQAERGAAKLGGVLLSALAHLGMVGGVLVFTFAYLTSAV